MQPTNRTVHLAWPLGRDLRVIPTHGEFRSLVRPMTIFARSCLVDLNRLINLRVASNAINARRLPLALLVYSLVRPLMTTTILEESYHSWGIHSCAAVHTVETSTSSGCPKHPLCIGRVGTSSDPEIISRVQTGRMTVCKLLRSQNEELYRQFGTSRSCHDSISLILVSLRKEYDSFVQNYNMHGMGKTVTELHAMIKLHEQTLPQKDVAPALHAIRAGRV
ncbi:hypothetical protein Tco_0556566 [Tanacetum coccineum]